jgi:uncharacterized protein (DUF2344 family)
MKEEFFEKNYPEKGSEFSEIYNELWEMALGNVLIKGKENENLETGEIIYSYLNDQAIFHGDEFAKRLAEKLREDLKEYEEFPKDYPHQMSALEAARTFLEKSKELS